MESSRVDNVQKMAKKKIGNGFFNMPRAVPEILSNILLERFSTTATLGNYKKIKKKKFNF